MRFATYGLLAFLAGCGGNGPGDDGPGSNNPDAGVATTINWTLRMGGTVLTCANANATEVRVLAKPEDGLDISKTYPCVLAPVMLSLPPGRYAIEASVLANGLFVDAPAKAVTVPASAQVMFDFYLQ